MMNLPQNGSVVIVDDQPNQALPIITALSKQGIATTWYRGNDPDELPEKPTQKVRLIFMDLQLVEGDNDPHTIASRIIQILEHLIPSGNGPYMLAIWSLKDAIYGDELKKRLIAQNNHLRPVCTVTLNKTDCIRKRNETGARELIEGVVKQLKKAGFEEGNLKSVVTAIEDNWIVDKDAEYEVLPRAIAIIENAIAEELKKAGVFHLFIIWENLIKSSAAQTVAYVSKTLIHDDNWEQNMRDVFRRMGIARVGQNVVSDEELLKESVLTFIQSFTDNLESEIHKVRLPDYVSKRPEQLIKASLENNEITLVYGNSSYQIRVNGKLIAEAGDLVKLQSKINSQAEAERNLANTLLSQYKAIPSKLNTGLHIESNPTQVHIPGNIFEIAVTEIVKRKKYLDTYFKSVDEAKLNDITFIELEISPICDYAQKNWKKSRLVSGIIYPDGMTIREKGHFYDVKPVFFLENGFKRMVFDYHLLKSLDHGLVEGRKIKYRLRRELLLDIIANVSAHVNRPGISFVS